MLQDKSPSKINNVDITKGSFTNFNIKNVEQLPVQPSSNNEVKFNSGTNCSLVKSVPDKSNDKNSTMPSHTLEHNKKTEADLVSKRVAKTKTEIEKLKAQLQKLISDGISKTDFAENKPNAPTITNTNNFTINPNIESTDVHLVKAKSFKDNAFSQKAMFPKSPSKNTLLNQEILKCSPKKIRHYNQEEAREYIKKQKQKYKELLKNKKKEVISVEQLKKQRLQELREKSLQLVSRNIQHKRDRSQSRETLNRQVEFAQIESHNLTDEHISSQKKIPKFTHPHIKNITIRSNAEDSAISKLELNLPVKTCDLEKRHNAALKIQTVFRGYQQRKIYKRMLKKNQVKEQEVQTYSPVEETPIWLQKPASLPYPYNFINAVKRKLNLAVKQSVNSITNDVAIQSSLITSPVENKMKIDSELSKKPSTHKNTDLKTFLSHKCLNLDVKTIEPLELKRKLSLNIPPQSKTDLKSSLCSDSDTSKNIPDISSESSINIEPKQIHSSKRSHSSDTDNKEKLRIYTDKVKKLKLRQPKQISSNLSDIQSSCIPEHISQITEEISDYAKTETDIKSKQNTPLEISLLQSTGRGSIIAFNKCNYKEVKSESKTNTRNDEHKLSGSLQSKGSIIKDESLTGQPSNVKSFKSENEYKETSVQKMSQSSKTMTVEGSPQYSSNFVSETSAIPSLKRPTISLKSSLHISSSEELETDGSDKRLANITLRPGQKSVVERKMKSNEIHLKFEAELHLLNEFNDSLRQVMDVEKSLLELHNKNMPTTICHTRDTQTSIVTKSSTDTKIPTKSSISEIINNKEQLEMSNINYSRGSEITEQLDILSLNDSNDGSFVMTGLELSQIKDSTLPSSNEESNVNLSISIINDEGGKNKNCAGISLEMFTQLIKDEDARIENLKAILKLREKALVDRTKGELAWLEIQKKHLRDSGQIQEISAIKKKQRGLLIKLEHERHEMQRLKQMQKAASKERKSALREQHNMIKAQLSTSNMLTKIKRNSKEEKRQSGPLKVYNIKSHSESIKSETSMSRKNSVTEEIISVVSRSESVVSHVSEQAVGEKVQEEVSFNSQIRTQSVKRSLLMREIALQKRRKQAEELLQWHQRLLEEEKKITELELAASAIINQNVNLDETTAEKYKLKGSKLNLLWLNMTGREEKKFNDQLTYSMSKINLEQFCKDAKKYTLGKNKGSSKKSGKHCNINEVFSNSCDEHSSPTEINSNDEVEQKTNKSSSQQTDYTTDFETLDSESLSLQSIIETNKQSSKKTDDPKLEITEIIDDISSLNEETNKNTTVNENVKVKSKTNINNSVNLSQSLNHLLEAHMEYSNILEKHNLANKQELKTNKEIESITDKSSYKQDVVSYEFENNSSDELEFSHTSNLKNNNIDNEVSQDNSDNNLPSSKSKIKSNQIKDINKLLELKEFGETNNESEKTINSDSEIPEEFNELFNSNINRYDFIIDEVKENKTESEPKGNINENHSESYLSNNNGDEHLSLSCKTSDVEKLKSNKTRAIIQDHTLSKDSVKSLTSDSNKSKINSEQKSNKVSTTVNTISRLSDNLDECLQSKNSKLPSLEIKTSIIDELNVHDESIRTCTGENINVKSCSEATTNLPLYENVNSKHNDDLENSEPSEVYNMLELKNKSNIVHLINTNSSLTNEISSVEELESLSKKSDRSENLIKTDNSHLKSKTNDKCVNSIYEKSSSDSPIINTENTSKCLTKSSASINENSAITNSTFNHSFLRLKLNEAVDEIPKEVNTENDEETLKSKSINNDINSDNKSSITISIENIHFEDLDELSKSNDESSITTNTNDIISKQQSFSLEIEYNKTNDELSKTYNTENIQLVDLNESSKLKVNKNDVQEHSSLELKLSKTTNETSSTENKYFDDFNEPSRTENDVGIEEKIKDDELIEEIKTTNSNSMVSEERSLISETNKGSTQTINTKLSKNIQKDVNSERDKSLIIKLDQTLNESLTNIITSVSTDDYNELSKNTDSLKLSPNDKFTISDLSEINVKNEDSVNTFNSKNNCKASTEIKTTTTDEMELSDIKNDTNSLQVLISQINKSDSFENEESSGLNLSKLISDSNLKISPIIDEKFLDEQKASKDDSQHIGNNTKINVDILQCNSNCAINTEVSAVNLQSQSIPNEAFYEKSLREQSDDAVNDTSPEDTTINEELPVDNDHTTSTSNTDLNSTKTTEELNYNQEKKEENSINNDNDNSKSVRLPTSRNSTPESDTSTKYKKQPQNLNISKSSFINDHQTVKQQIDNIEPIDVRKRVSEILADANISPRGEKSPRLQDFYVTTYDVISPENSPDSASPTDDADKSFTSHPIYGNEEVEELLKKQLAIEQEIKEIQEQQKEQLPYLYVREIPNKPPPPYTPPTTTVTSVKGSILPASESEISIISNISSDILYDAYINNNLQNVLLSKEKKINAHNLYNIDKCCFEFVFDLCKEVAIEHYKQFEIEKGPSWTHLKKLPKLALGKPFNKIQLEKLINKKVRQFLGYEVVKATENIKGKWSSKKRDHVDELLVVECQAEETEWTNYDRDELIVKDELTKEIMNMLLNETAQVLNDILAKKTC